MSDREIGTRRGFITPESTPDEKLHMQNQLRGAGINLDEISVNQTFDQFARTLSPGQEVVVPSFSAVFGSMPELLIHIIKLTERDINVVSVDEPWFVVNHTNINLLQSLVTLDSRLRAVQTKRGLRRAKDKGTVLGRPVGSTTVRDNVKMAHVLHTTMNLSVDQACRTAGCHPRTYYRYMEMIKKAVAK